MKKELVAGRRLTEVIPGIEKDSAGWIDKFGAVVATGQPVRFENYSETLGRWYSIAAYRPEEGFLMVVFEEITKRKLAEEEILQTRDLLEKRVEKRTAELERMNRELSASEKQLRFLSTKLMSAQEQERKRIAGDLHDGVCSSMAAVKFGLEEALERCAIDETMASTLENLVQATVNSISEMRRIMADLHPHLLEEMGYIAAVDRFIRDFRKIYARIEVERKIDLHENEIPEHLKIVLFRITQEAFNNIAKHSEATVVRFSVSKWGDIIELFIKDNGKGFDTNSVMTMSNSHEGFGLPGMIERAELNGGTFEVESAPGEGTTVRVYFTETKRTAARLGVCG